MLTFFRSGNHFSIWSVPDGQLVAVNRGDPDGQRYQCAGFGVPGSTSDGLVGLCSGTGVIDLRDVSAPLNGEANRPRLRSHPDLAPTGTGLARGFAFSGDGSKFTLAFSGAFRGVAYVYDVASLTRLAAYTSPWRWAMAAWAPDGRHVLVTGQNGGWGNSACVWDFSRPEAPSIVTAAVVPGARFRGWSPSGASYFLARRLEEPALTTYLLEERRAADKSLLRAVNLRLSVYPHSRVHVTRSPDAHALVLHFSENLPAPRVVVFD